MTWCRSNASSAVRWSVAFPAWIMIEFTTLATSWRAVVGSLEGAALAKSRSFANWALFASNVAEGLRPRAWGAAARARNENNIAGLSAVLRHDFLYYSCDELVPRW